VSQPLTRVPALAAKATTAIGADAFKKFTYDSGVNDTKTLGP
jgi:hypothetical protein